MNKKSAQTPFDWTNQSVLVTGADGFVGRRLAAELAERGAQVCALIWKQEPSPVHPPVSWPSAVEVMKGDVCDLDALRHRIGHSAFNLVYHLAASNVNIGAETSPYDIFETNTRGTYTLLEACRSAHRPPQVILASSHEAEDCHRPGTRKFHPYMVSKASAEWMVRTYSDMFGIPAVIARSNNIYGGGDTNWRRLIPGTLQALFRGEPPTLRSDGQLLRDYVYIDDAIAAYRLIGEHQSRDETRVPVYRISTGHRVSALDIVNQLVALSKRPDLKPRVLNQSSNEREDAIYVPDFEKTQLGWQAQYSLEKGLSLTCDWYRKFFLDSEKHQT